MNNEGSDFITVNSGIIFDVASKSFDWAPVEIAAVVFLGGAIGSIQKRIVYRGRNIPALSYLTMLFSLLFAVCYTVGWQVSQKQNIAALKAGRYDSVEGPVENLRPMLFHGRKEESFTISRHTFRYSDERVSTCFNKTSIHGGPIHEGMFLSVYFTDNCILRIEDRAN